MNCLHQRLDCWIYLMCIKLMYCSPNCISTKVIYLSSFCSYHSVFQDFQSYTSYTTFTTNLTVFLPDPVASSAILTCYNSIVTFLSSKVQMIVQQCLPTLWPRLNSTNPKQQTRWKNSQHIFPFTTFFIQVSVAFFTLPHYGCVTNSHYKISPCTFNYAIVNINFCYAKILHMYTALILNAETYL